MKKLKNAIVLLVASAMVMTLFIPRAFSDPHAQQKKEARAAAEKWLNLIDAQKYDASWEEAASFFKGAISQEQWKKSVASVRGPIGQKKSRTFKSAHFETSLPGAPDGQYVVIQFTASFANKKKAVETITPMLDKDGKWRVSGYYIK